MAAPKKLPVDRTSTAGGLSGLAKIVSEHLAIPVPDRASNYDAMCEAVTGSGQRSVRCRKCAGSGFSLLPEDQIALWAKKLAEVHAPGEHTKAVEDYRRAQMCGKCKGVGFRLTTSSVQRTMCDTCHGRQRLADGSECPGCSGAGMWSLGRPDGHRWNTVRCWRCTGRVHQPGSLSPKCPVCSGSGHTIPVTVFETGCSKKGKLPPGAEPGSSVSVQASASGRLWCQADAMPDEEAAAAKERRRITGIIDWVGAHDAEAAEALEQYLGEAGDRWKCIPSRGRVFAVWPVTDAGKELLGPEYAVARIRGLTSLVRPHDRLDAIRREEAQTPIPSIHVRALLNEADEQARDLVERAQALIGEASEA